MQQDRDATDRGTAPPPARRLREGDPDIDAVLALIRAAFASMEGRVDPPSSMHRLDRLVVSRHAGTGEVWVLGDPVVACVFLTPEPGRLYLGKLAVAAEYRRRGYAQLLVDLACDRARALGLGCVELHSRIELVENHAAFVAMGFRKVGETAHPGYDRPTSITFRKSVS